MKKNQLLEFCQDVLMQYLQFAFTNLKPHIPLSFDFFFNLLPHGASPLPTPICPKLFIYSLPLKQSVSSFPLWQSSLPSHTLVQAMQSPLAHLKLSMLQSTAGFFASPFPREGEGNRGGGQKGKKVGERKIIPLKYQIASCYNFTYTNCGTA